MKSLNNLMVRTPKDALDLGLVDQSALQRRITRTFHRFDGEKITLMMLRSSALKKYDRRSK